MRLNKLQIEHLAFSIVKGLWADDLIITEDREGIVTHVQEIIVKELEKEDQLGSFQKVRIWTISLPWQGCSWTKPC